MWGYIVDNKVNRCNVGVYIVDIKVNRFNVGVYSRYQGE